MHPSLSAATLRSLPSFLRKFAAAAVDGSTSDLLKTIGHARAQPPPISLLFLPVFHAHLDPAKARLLARKDPEGLAPADANLVVLAFLGLQGLSVIQEIPGGACPDLWPGVSQWSQLIVRHHDCLAAVLKQTSEGPITALFVIVRIHKLCEDTSYAKTIAAAPGLRTMVASVWVLLSRKNVWKPGLQTEGCNAALHFVGFMMDLENRQHLDDLVEGCGGSLGDFATLLVKCISHLGSGTSIECCEYSCHFTREYEYSYSRVGGGCATRASASIGLQKPWYSRIFAWLP
ncbi:hypothetical protein FB45DRAFT_1065880 [Roridomyces roridus]|uniref:Uncharacterized protein n=1 Tax=Roridomyces roridus TaxID=1738132 RepID=A0AAD7B5B2_9AGAR|nr:hypothetical protein FB45DRAFT_1065880 [Roridomyces roridus]